jgi:hypothetical protein
MVTAIAAAAIAFSVAAAATTNGITATAHSLFLYLAPNFMHGFLKAITATILILDSAMNIWKAVISGSGSCSNTSSVITSTSSSNKTSSSISCINNVIVTIVVQTTTIISVGQ